MPPPPLGQPLFTAPDLVSLSGLAEAAWAAYASRTRIRNACDQRNLPFHWFERAETQAFGIQIDEQTRLLAFRGTEIEHMRDFAVDAQVWLKRAAFHTWKAHSGFYRAYEAVQGDVCRFAVEGLHAGRVFITGHSLGGALAVLCGLDVAGTAGLRSHIVTFGQPRIGDARFCELTRGLMDAKVITYTRVVHNNDIVPHIPAPTGYRHCGEVIYLDRNQNPSEPTFRDWYLGLWDRVQARKLNDPTTWSPDGIIDHRMGGYLTGMRNYEAKNL